MNICQSSRHAIGCITLSSVNKILPVRENWLHGALKAAEIVQEQPGFHISRGLAYHMLCECVKQKNLEWSRQVCFLIVRSGLESVEILTNHLIRLFTTLGNFIEANQIFSKVSKPTEYTWSTIITTYVKLQQGQAALRLYDRMIFSGMEGNKHVYVAVLQACIATLNLNQGRHIHRMIIRSQLESDVVIGNALIDMYAKCGSLEEAREVFSKMSNRNVVTWTAMISAYAQHGEGLLALECFSKMQQEGEQPNQVTYSSILKACTCIGAIEQGAYIHKEIIKNGFEADIFVGSALVDMYGKCGCLKEARDVFDRLPKQNIVSWSAMIIGYAQHNEGILALECFDKMQYEGIKPNEVTYLGVLKACGSIKDIYRSRCIHKQIKESGLHYDVFIASAIVDMYAKCGSLEEACEVFNKLRVRNVVSWNAMIAGYVQHSEGLHALNYFERMQHEGIKPSEITFSSVLKACASIGAIGRGRRIHEQIVKSSLQNDIFLANTLIDMYGKCGGLEEANKVFSELPYRDEVSWNAMIAGYAQCGNFPYAVKYFENMQHEGIEPNDVAFLIILVACSHAGMVNDGLRYFRFMKEERGIIPNTSHFACMVDILGRSGYLNEACDLLLIVNPDMAGWMSLLVACGKYGNMNIGRKCFDEVQKLNPHHAAAYAVMAGIYSDVGMWKEAAKIEELRQHAGAWKKPAKAWIEINENVHEFVVGDKSHPRSEEIYDMLKKLSNQIKCAGYAPNIDVLLQQTSDGEKEDALCGHSERLALAFGFISAPPGSTIRITKNLRMCMNCHTATKVISKIERREIIIRDVHCLHHFKNGSCSCWDYFDA